ncbi:efflux RND transporter periplasmic adaptor subunit [Fuscibacter oryzae]|uniref:Efflux RND transporter periplasmic adaptor subunit n=1 Tax=Fuscibacter oryzae TaxID=2803939 RepID=A0A8J7MRU1_9RHOB|nr:HlyD family efflux transporter periplasmic adaptor subunit [Fuscibacter oryzae]MBL4927745.1 efflux RND transporter periplasmic adaptor subunit [Fuscibacter oryzae]
MCKPVLTAICLALVTPAFADAPAPVKQVQLTEWKAVYGTVEARLRVPARARIGGTITELAVTEGDVVAEGQVLARIVDEKLGFQLSALEAQKTAAEAQLANAQAELTRGQELLKQGVTTVQRLDALRTQVDVVTGQIAALEAQARVIAQSEAEGAVLAPAAGRVLEVPVAKGAVVMPGEPVATLAAGGTFLRIAVPERHAANLHQGDTIEIEGAEGRLAKVYPLISGGRVTADVEVADLSDRFIDARVLVRLPVGQRPALVVPEGEIASQSGLDFVQVEGAEGPVARVVVPGQHQVIDGQKMVEILSGLTATDRVLGGGNE